MCSEALRETSGEHARARALTSDRLGDRCADAVACHVAIDALLRERRRGRPGSRRGLGLQGVQR